MILHLCHHWFWITILSVLLTMSAIVKTQEQDMDEVQPTSEPGRTNTSHPPPVRSKLKAALFNVTRLYPVPDNVPDRSLSSGPELTSLAQNIPSPSSASSPSGGGEDNVTTKEADHAGQINTNRSDGDGQPSPDRSDDERHLRFDGSVDVPWSNPEANDDKQSIPDIAVNVENWGVLERIDRTLFASKEVESREFPSQPSDHDKPISPPTHSSTLQEAVTSDRTELLTDSDSSPANANQSERLEREIRKVNATQTVDIEHLPSFQPGSDGSEHGKLNQHTQEFARKISSTVTPLLDTHLNDSNHDDNLDDVKYETEQGGYTIFVTPPSPHTPTPNDLTTQTRSTPTTQSSTIAPVEVVKKSENVSKIRDKSVTEFKAKYSSKIKDKTTPLKPVIVVESSTNFVTPEPASTSTISILSGDTTPVQDLISPTPVLTRTNINTGRPRDYEVMNDSPVAQENATDLALENTSISADYEELNHTSPASANLSSSRSSAHGRMLDVVPPLAHAEDLSNPWGGRGGELNVALISGISFGALALVTLLGAVSFIMYRRYRWNKPQTLSDKCSNPDSSGYIDDSTLRENSEEMYSLDNDSFLNSLEAMTIQNYWTDHVKHTKL